MKLLAIETATDVCSIGIIENGTCVHLFEDNIPREHAEKLPLFYEELMNKSKFTLQEIDAIAVSIGPGSFTGLRIGLSYAKGLAYSYGKPIIPVPTLESLLFGRNSDFKNALVILLSHGNKYYLQRFEKNTNGYQGDDIQPIELSSIKEIGGLTNDYLIIQYGCEKLFNDISISYKTINPSARLIGELAYINYNEWVNAEPYKIVPQYISPFKIGG